MLGTAVRNSNQSAHRAIDKARALMLTEQIVTYYDTGQFEDERDVSAAFGEQGPPGWGWSLRVVEDQNVEGLERVTVRIVEGDPEGGPEAQRPILVTNFLRAEKQNFDLVEDFGMSDDQVDQLMEAIPGGAALLDPTDFDPTSLARLDMDTLVELLPLIMASMAELNATTGGGLPGRGLPGGGSPDQLMGALQNATGGGGSGGTSSRPPSGGRGG
ncbi:MAG: hypothetical protein V3T70_10180 [Phycisphaerae bacterium]